MTRRFQYLQEILATSPNDPFVLFAIAKEYEGQGDQANALRYYQQVQETDKDYVGMYYHLGKLYENLNNIDKAIETYKTGIEIARKVSDMHAAAELSAALLNLEDPDDV